MNLFIYTGARDLVQCAATTEADCNALIAALANPTTTANATTLARIASGFPQMVLGDSEPLVVKFMSAASTYESWSGSSGYAVTASLGLLSHDGVENYAETDDFTAITNGWSGRLALSTQDLIDAVQQSAGEGIRTLLPRFGFNSNRGVALTLQVRVTDGSGNRETYAIPQITLVGSVNAAGVSAPNPAVNYLTAAEIAAAYQARANGYNAQANSSGNSTVTPASAYATHTEIVTFSGSARTSVVILSTTGRTSGDVLRLRLNMPATSAIVAEVRNASAVGTLLASLTTDGSGDDCFIQLTFNGTAWDRDFTAYPA
jgi:hypothetical protein